MANRKNYTVLIGYPKGGGHWAQKGEKVDLLAIEAAALVQAGRIKLTADVEAEQAAAAEPQSEQVAADEQKTKKGAK